MGRELPDRAAAGRGHASERRFGHSVAPERRRRDSPIHAHIGLAGGYILQPASSLSPSSSNAHPSFATPSASVAAVALPLVTIAAGRVRPRLPRSVGADQRHPLRGHVRSPATAQARTLRVGMTFDVDGHGPGAAVACPRGRRARTRSRTSRGGSRTSAATVRREGADVGQATTTTRGASGPTARRTSRSRSTISLTRSTTRSRGRAATSCSSTARTSSSIPRVARSISRRP